MPTKDVYQELVNARIETIYEAMGHHERHLQSTESTSSEAHEAALRELKGKRRHLDELQTELEDAGEHAWQSLREHIDSAIEDLKSATEHARERLRGSN